MMSFRSGVHFSDYCFSVLIMFFVWCFFLFFKQKTAYDMRISDWSSDVCSSVLSRSSGPRVSEGRMSGYGAPQVVATGLRFPEGPVPMPDGSVLLVEIARGTLTRVAPDGSLSVVAELRSEERRVGKECGRTCRSRLSQSHVKQHTDHATLLTNTTQE